MNYLLTQIKTKNSLNAGFTVIEMITVISIFSILTAILLFNYNTFQKNTDFSVFAQEVGMLIKKHQQNAMAGKFPELDPQLKQYPDPGWKPAYGVYLEVGGSAITEYYDIYNDPSETYVYSINAGGQGCDSNPNDECYNIASITNGRQIVGIYEGGYPNGTSLNNLSIEFERPYPDAHMKKDYQSFVAGSTNAQDVTDLVDIVLEDPNVSGYNIVTINPVGAISVRRAQ